MTQDKLSRGRWLEAGLNALACSGPETLKAEKLARRLGTTKGSFYWHFKDVPDFHSQLLSHWKAQALAAAVAGVEHETSEASALRKLAQIAAGSAENELSAALEPAVRAWARSNTAAAVALAEIDAERLRYFTNLLKRCGVPNPHLARALYASAIGMQELSAHDKEANTEPMGTLVDLMLALR